MKTFKIGDKAYLVDNSYATCIENNEPANLAGTAWDDPQLVEIISEPYIATRKGTVGDRENEFVKVKFEEKEYEVLNNFTDIFDNSLQSEFADEE